MVSVEIRHFLKAYQDALQFLEQAKGYEAGGEESQAKDFYFRAANWAEIARSDRHLLDNRRRELATRLVEFDAELSPLPDNNAINSLFSQIYHGLNGAVQALWGSSEREEWEKKEQQRIWRQVESDSYLLKAEVDLQKTARVIDVLREIDWLRLSYERVFELPPQQREYVGTLMARQKRRMEAVITRKLSESLGIPVEAIKEHDIRVDLGLFDNLSVSALHGKHIDIQKKEEVTVGLNVDGKTGEEIVRLGFTSMRGEDPQLGYFNRHLVYIANRQQAGRPRWELSGGYDLMVHNPRRKILGHEPENIPVQAIEHAEHIDSLLLGVLSKV